VDKCVWKRVDVMTCADLRTSRKIRGFDTRPRCHVCLQVKDPRDGSRRPPPSRRPTLSLIATAAVLVCADTSSSVNWCTLRSRLLFLPLGRPSPAIGSHCPPASPPPRVLVPREPLRGECLSCSFVHRLASADAVHPLGSKCLFCAVRSGSLPVTPQCSLLSDPNRR